MVLTLNWVESLPAARYAAELQCAELGKTELDRAELGNTELDRAELDRAVN